jgi:hypothetical protein
MIPPARRCVSPNSGSEPEVLREAWPDDDVYHLVVTKPLDLHTLTPRIALARRQISQAPR